MRFGLISYLNMLPFAVFLKGYPMPLRLKSIAFAKCSYPARLNQDLFFRRLEAGFISSIAGYHAHRMQKATLAGICAKGAVWSVLTIDKEGLMEGVNNINDDMKELIRDIKSAQNNLHKESMRSANNITRDIRDISSADIAHSNGIRLNEARALDYYADTCACDNKRIQNAKAFVIASKSSPSSLQANKISAAIHNLNSLAYTPYARSRLSSFDYRMASNDKSPCAIKAQLDYQSNTSNALSAVLGLSGQVLIGDRALRYRYAYEKSAQDAMRPYIDMGEAWRERHHLPFVFGRLCYNKSAALTTRIARAFLKKYGRTYGDGYRKGGNKYAEGHSMEGHTKRHNKHQSMIKRSIGYRGIPHYIMAHKAQESALPISYVCSYLCHIHYAMGTKELLSLARFYRAARLERIKIPTRIYPRNIGG